MSSDSDTHRQAHSSLVSEMESLQRQLGELGFGDTATGLDYDANFADSSQVTAEKDQAASLAASLREALGEVRHALAKIEAGEFGVCENCGQEIAAARIEAMPTSRHCIDCASKPR